MLAKVTSTTSLEEDVGNSSSRGGGGSGREHAIRVGESVVHVRSDGLHEPNHGYHLQGIQGQIWNTKYKLSCCSVESYFITLGMGSVCAAFLAYFSFLLCHSVVLVLTFPDCRLSDSHVKSGNLLFIVSAFCF